MVKINSNTEKLKLNQQDSLVGTLLSKSYYSAQEVNSFKGLCTRLNYQGSLMIYCCGPTLYSDLHLGNYRSLFFLDYCNKYRKNKGLDTKIIVNLTDLDDKIFSKLKVELGTSLTDVHTTELHDKLVSKITEEFKRVLETYSVNLL